MNNTFKNSKQKSSKKEKMSRKQKIYQAYIGILAIVLITAFILLGYSVDKNILWLMIVSGVLLPIAAIPLFILERLEEKEFKRVTSKSIDYYKRRSRTFIYQEFVAGIGSIVLASIFIGVGQLKLDLNTLYSICIGTFSLVPIVYVFILPQIKETINSTRRDLSSILTQLSSTKKSSNIKILKKKQGEIYRLINLSNHANIELIIGIAFFVIAIIMFFNPEENIAIQAFPTASIFYSLYEICVLIKLSRDSYSYNKKEFETKMKNQVLNIEKNEKAKQKKELLKVYTRDGKYSGENCRENCLKPRFKGFYKTAYIIIRNKQNKYFVYQQILDYENALYRWQTTYQSDELAKRNIKDSLINKFKDDFNISINKTNFKLINKDINSDKHQLIEIYLVTENLNNKDIDYNIDLYTTAKFVPFKRFVKLFTLSNELPENLVKDVRLKLTEQDNVVNKEQN